MRTRRVAVPLDQVEVAKVLGYVVVYDLGDTARGRMVLMEWAGDSAPPELPTDPFR